MTGTLFGRYLESVISGYQSYIHQQVGFCINLMGKTEGDSIPDNLAEKIGALDVVLGYNAESSLDVTPSDFQNYIPSELLEREGEWEGDKSQVRMWGAVNTQYSTYFFQRQAELLEGRYPKKGSNEVVIEQEFAAYNHLSITDRIHIMRNKDESELALQVVGIYKINQQVSESIMISDVNGFYQNTSSSYIFCDYEMLEQISGTKMPKTTYSFYAKDEKGAEKLEEYIKGLELDSYEYSNVSKEAEGNFSNFLVMLQQNSRNLLNIANISIYCILFLMILLWMRDH